MSNWCRLSKMSKRSILGIFLFLLFSPSLNAQKKYIKFEQITTEQGLSQNTVRCIYQDSKGFLWFGTTNGLNRYDGYDFKIYLNNPSDSTTISLNSIWTIYEDREGLLWIGTNGGGLNKYDREKEIFTSYKNDPDNSSSISHNSVRSIYEDKKGILWIGTDGGGLNRFDKETGTFNYYIHDKNNPHSISNNRIWSILEDSNGNLWIGTYGGGLNRFNRKNNRFTHYSPDSDNKFSISSNRIRTIIEDREGILWIGTNDGGINRFNPKEKKFYHYKNTPGSDKCLANNRVRTIFEDRSGNLWMGTLEGLCRYNRKNNQFLTYTDNPLDKHSLTDKSIWSIYEDHSGVLWIGTINGLNKYNRKNEQFLHFRKIPGNPNSLSDNVVRAISEDRKGTIWIGTDGGGLNRFDVHNETFVHYQHKPEDPNSISSSRIRAVLEDKRGNLWIGTYGGGLNKFDGRKFKAYKTSHSDTASISSNQVWTLYEDRQGVLWVGTYGGGLNRFDWENETFSVCEHEPYNPSSISNDRITCIFEPENDSENLWIGTIDGLNKFNRKTGLSSRYYSNKEDLNSLGSSSIRVIYEDKNGYLWIGTHNGGLNKFNPETDNFLRYTMSEGLPDNSIYGILEDEIGNLWLSTNKGLSKFDPETEEFTNYDKYDGLQNNEFKEGAYFKTSDGSLLFGGINGFNLFNPSEIKKNSTAPKIVITDFQILNRSVPPELIYPRQKSIMETDVIEIPYKKNVISFEFSALHYTAPEKNRYKYIMEGFDEDWTDAEKRRHVTYTNFSPGEYVFRVKASNCDGIWNEEGTGIRIKIIPPFWLTMWFKIIMGIFIIGIAYAVVRYRYISAHRKKLGKLVSERTKELRKAYDEMEIKVRDRTKDLTKTNIKLKKEITGRKKAEEDRRKTEEQLFQAQKLESIGRLAGGIAHDFNNILAGIMGFAELLNTKYNNPDSFEGKASRIILDGTTRAANLTKQLLGFARGGKYNPVPLNINNVIVETINMLENIFEKTINLKYIFEESIGVVEADKNQLEQVFANIIINAKESMPEGGDLCIKTENISINKNMLSKNPVYRKGDFVKISITDTGHGISEDIQDKIFEPFFSTKKKSGRTGLGLAMVYGIIKNHRGFISVQSSPGTGSSFIIYFPRTKKSIKKVKKNKETPVKGKGTILLVDDEENIRDLIKTQLDLLGYNVLSANNGKEAIEIYNNEHKNIDLILLDLIMPVMSGMDAFIELKKLNPDIKILLMSGYSQYEKANELLKNGAKGFLQKPFKISEFSKEISKLMVR